MPLLASSTWIFVIFATVVAGVYATGMVITRKRLSKVRGLDPKGGPAAKAEKILRAEPGHQDPDGGATDTGDDEDA